MKAVAKKNEGNKLVAVMGDEVLDIKHVGYSYRVSTDWNWREKCQRLNKLLHHRLK